MHGTDFRLRHCLFSTALALAAPLAGALGVAECRREADDSRRLACYDSLFREDAPAAARADRPASPAGESRPPAPAEREGAAAPSVIGTFWELEPEDKRGTFIVRTYLPNFLLPLHASSSINKSPSSPAHGTASLQPNYRAQEAKLQISLRAKMAENLLLPGADLWFAYTQRSFWQVWNRRDSAPFRSTDYQPEAIYVVPLPRELGTLPGGWRWRMVQLGLAHQSNGQSEPLSRSWNRIYAGAAFEHGEFGLSLRRNRRLQEGDGNDNPDLTRYVGHTEIMAAWLPGPATAALTWRTDLNSLSRGSLQLDWTYPVDREQPAGLRWYLQLFSGYGETLLDYNHRQNSIGLGLTLFQF